MRGIACANARPARAAPEVVVTSRSGVPGMQPALSGSKVVLGDPSVFARAVLLGPAEVLPADRPQMGNEIISSDKIHLCPSCQRIVYIKPVELEEAKSA